MKKNGNCSREDCDIIKRRIMDGLSEFVQAGAMTPELAGRSSFSPEDLLAPQPKLLTAVRTVIEEGGNGEAGQSTAEDIRRLEDVLRGMSKEEREAWLRGLDRKPSAEE